jgi:hypothetical protein
MKKLIFAFLACMAFSGCGWSTPSVLKGNAIEGRITDADTNSPVPGAIVLVLWEGNSIPTGLFAHAIKEICFYAAVTTSDANGQYKTPSWTQPNLYNVDKSYARVFAYKKEFWLPEQYISNHPGSRLNKENADFPNIKMKRFKGTVEERLAQFRGSQNHCIHAPSEDALYPLTNAQLEEARALAGDNDPTVLDLQDMSKSRMKKK